MINPWAFLIQRRCYYLCIKDARDLCEKLLWEKWYCGERHLKDIHLANSINYIFPISRVMFVWERFLLKTILRLNPDSQRSHVLVAKYSSLQTAERPRIRKLQFFQCEACEFGDKARATRATWFRDRDDDDADYGDGADGDTRLA